MQQCKNSVKSVKTVFQNVCRCHTGVAELLKSVESGDVSRVHEVGNGTCSVVKPRLDWRLIQR
jgi:selenophosphate synthase